MARRSAPAPIQPRRTGRNLIAFGWYGGKYSHLEWLFPLLPQTRQYCEPFAGSGAVLLNRPPSPVETYNDLDGEVVNFFRVLRTSKSKLVEQVGLTPFSREEFARAREPFYYDSGQMMQRLYSAGKWRKYAFAEKRPPRQRAIGRKYRCPTKAPTRFPQRGEVAVFDDPE